MKTYSTDFALVIFVCLSLLKCEANSASKQFQATVYSPMNTICHDGFMSVYIPKVQFAALPFSIFVQDEYGKYYQAIAIAKQCHYFFEESDTVVVLTVASHGCFVRRQKYVTSLNVTIVAPANRGSTEIVKSISLICARKIKEANQKDYLPLSGQLFCSNDGFNITILRNATVPPLSLDAVWIPSSQSHNCKPKTRSSDAVTFSFPFTSCGTKSMIADGKITYWVNIEVKPQKGSIIFHPSFHLAVQCSFALAQLTQVGIKVQREAEHPSTLKGKGVLRTEMRFAKDSSYRSFYSSHNPPTLTELGQPVYVEVFVLKHENKDLVLLLEDCWATPSRDPHDQQRWNLLVKGCPFTGDSHRTVVLPVVSSKELKYPSLHKRFVVKLFSFLKPQTSENLVYFHCDIEICKGPGCLNSCHNGRRNLRRIIPGTGQRILDREVSGGPLLYLL
uniref:zona pellucida sperm-binding protein 4-like n=1 Tax=Monopterus albus TaxID=43700 RepID=UPI0009B41384|nr:zona pellucida sperm-binding protein 4-like [Monopterus albus]